MNRRSKSNGHNRRAPRNKQLRISESLGDLERLLVDKFTSVDLSEDANTSIALTFVAVTNHEQQFYQVDLGPKAGASLREIAAKFLDQLEENVYSQSTRVLPFDPVANLDAHEIEYLPFSVSDVRRSRVAPLEKPKQLPQLEDNDLKNPNLRYYVISILPPDGAWLHCFRVMTEGSQPQRTKLLISRGHGAGYFDTLSDPVYLLDPHNIDCIWCDDYLFIVDKDRFERIFDVGQNYHEDVLDVVKTVASRLPFSNEGEFLEACQNDPRMAAKVARMKGQPHLDRLSIERAREVKQKCGLAIEFEPGPDGTDMLRFVAKYKWQYVKILGDEYARTLMADLLCETNGRRVIRLQDPMELAPIGFQELTAHELEISRN